MRKIIGYAAIFLTSGLIASQVTSQSSTSSIPDPAKEYQQTVDCHNAYDHALSEIQGGAKPAPALSEWMKTYEANAITKTAKCPAPLPEMVAQGGRWVLRTEQGQNYAALYALNQQDPAAFSEVGHSWVSGIGNQGTPQRGLELIQQAAQLGDVVATYTTATLYAAGYIGGKKDQVTAYTMLKKAADAGHVDARYRTGLYLMDGIGTKKDTKAAYAAFQSAAERGHLYGAIMAWDMLNNGNGVRQDWNEAARLSRVVIAQGQVYGAVMLVSSLLQGKNPQDHEDEVLYWFDYAVRNGDANIRNQMAPMRDRLIAAFHKAKAPPQYQPRVWKACPMKTVCLVDHYSGVQQCTTNKDYWHDCDG
jgi:TPR repeat protein